MTTTAREPGELRIAPGPGGHLMLGALLDVWRDRLGLMTRVTDEFGDAIRFKMGPKTLYFFNHPDHAKHVLVERAGNYRKGIGLIQAKRVLGEGLLTSEGELWKRHRRIIQPVFHRERVVSYAGVVVREARRMIDRWRTAAGPLNVGREMTDLTLSVLGSTLLDADLGSRQALGDAFEVAQDQAMFEMVTLGMVPPWAPTGRNRRFRAAQRELQQLVDRMVELKDSQHRDGDDTGTDMLSRLMREYRDEPDARLKQRRLRDELVTILLAGHETTASTLSWTWQQVDEHPHVAERMHEEACAALGDRDPVYEDLHRLPYTTMVIQEAMRLYPPVWLLPRRAVAEDVIDGYRVPAGADVLICPYTLHRHPGFWPDPERFDPERFGTDRVGARHRYAYIPFGAGPRFCVGNNLGMMEAVLVAAMVAREFRLRLVPGHEVEPEPMLSLRAKGGLPMTVHRR
jgi:enediyne biosynthesis protein E7